MPMEKGSWTIWNNITYPEYLDRYFRDFMIVLAYSRAVL